LDKGCQLQASPTEATRPTAGKAARTDVGHAKGSKNWSDYPNSIDLVGDVNGDGRADLVWSSSYQSAAKTNNNLVVVGMANSNGTFQIGPIQDFGSAWSGSLFLANLNRDNRADLVWNNAPFYNTDVDTYAAGICLVF
jgi:FG-GAP-like repeat